MHALRAETPTTAPASLRSRAGTHLKLVTASAARRPAGWSGSRVNWATVAVIVAGHVLIVGALLAQKETVSRAKAPSLITVELITPIEPPKPPPPPPRPKPQPVKQWAPVPLAPPPPVVVPDFARLQELPSITLPPVEPKPVPQQVVAAALAPVAAAPAPAPLVPPRYDAAYLDNPPPAYPSISRRQHEEGRVLLRVQVTADGRAGSVEIETSSGHERLDRAALDAVRRWRFVPAKRGDEAVAASALVPIVFSLERR
jgi:protein TonB